MAVGRAHVKEHQETWLPGQMLSVPIDPKNPAGSPLPSYSLSDRSRSPGCGGKNAKTVEEMEPRFMSWNFVALYAFNFFSDERSRKKIQAAPSRKLQFSVGYCNDVYSRVNDQSRSKWPCQERVMVSELSKELRRGIYVI